MGSLLTLWATSLVVLVVPYFPFAWWIGLETTPSLPVHPLVAYVPGIVAYVVASHFINPDVDHDELTVFDRPGYRDDAARWALVANLVFAPGKIVWGTVATTIAALSGR